MLKASSLRQTVKATFSLSLGIYDYKAVYLVHFFVMFQNVPELLLRGDRVLRGNSPRVHGIQALAIFVLRTYYS